MPEKAPLFDPANKTTTLPCGCVLGAGVRCREAS